MAYSLKTKNAVLDQLQQGTHISIVARMYNIPRQTIWTWVNSKTRGTSKIYDIEEKIEVLDLLESSGLSIHEVSALKNIKFDTIRRWVEDKTRIRALYSSQGRCLMDPNEMLAPREELTDISLSDDKDTRQHIRDLRDENEYLKAKVAYLEALMELNGTPASSFKKNTIPGHRLGPQKRDRKREPALPYSRGIPEELLLLSRASVLGFRCGNHRSDPQLSGGTKRRDWLPSDGPDCLSEMRQEYQPQACRAPHKGKRPAFSCTAQEVL